MSLTAKCTGSAAALKCNVIGKAVSHLYNKRILLYRSRAFTSWFHWYVIVTTAVAILSLLGAIRLLGAARAKLMNLEGRIQEVMLWNTAACRVTGFAASDALGSALTNMLYHTENDDSFAKLCHSSVCGPVWGCLSFLHSVHGTVTVSVNVQQLCDDRGMPCGHILWGKVPMDLENEAAVTKLHTWAHIELLRKVEELQNLAAPSTCPSSVAKAVKELARFVRLVDPVKVTDRYHAIFGYESLSIKGMFGHAISAFLGPAQDRGVTFSVDVSPAVPEVMRADKSMLPLAVERLINSAICGTPKGGSVRVKVECISGLRESFPTLEVTLLQQSTGDGSLGLQMDNSIAGKLEVMCGVVESWAGRTCVRLPLVQPEQNLMMSVSSNTTTSSATEVGSEGFRSTVLVMESSFMARLALSQMAWDSGQAIVVARTIIEADQMLQRLVDVHLALVDSPLFYQQVVAAYPDILVVATFTPSDGSDVPHVLTRPFKRRHFARFMAVANEIHQERFKTRQRKQDMQRLLSEHRTCPWVREDKLGRGANGDVYRARNTVTGGIMAVKIILLQNIDSDAVRKVLDEIELMSLIDHDNIISYLYCEKGNEAINLFMEYADGGSLKGYIDHHGPLTDDQAALYVRDLLLALQYLHVEKSVAHRDIKCANILLCNGRAKLADFGVSAKLGSDGALRGVVGTLRFMAPEVVSEQEYCCSVDIWSLGCTVVEMLSGKPPFEHLHDACAASVVCHIGSMADLAAVEVDVGFELHGEVKSFVASCLSTVPELRPSASTLLNHPFITRRSSDMHMSAFDTKVPGYMERTVQRSSNCFKNCSFQSPFSSNRSVNEEPESDIMLMMRQSNGRRFSGWDS